MSITSDTPGYACKEGLYGQLYVGETGTYTTPASLLANMAKLIPASDVTDNDSANLYDTTEKGSTGYVSQQPGLKSGTLSTTIFRHEGLEYGYDFLKWLYRTKKRGLFVYASGDLTGTLTEGDDGYMFEGVVSEFTSAQPVNGLQTVAITITKCRHIADLRVTNAALAVVAYTGTYTAPTAPVAGD